MEEETGIAEDLDGEAIRDFISWRRRNRRTLHS
jgi:hypothetical protein